MISFFNLTHRFKRSMYEIRTVPYLYLDWEDLDHLQAERPLENLTFTVKAGKKAYDIIRVYENIGHFYSQRVIDVLSQFVDMSDKCYPINIQGAEQQYYAIYNLKAYPFFNKKECVFIDDPMFFGVQDKSLPIFGIEGTLYIIVSEDVKNALLKNKITNIELMESFGCTKEEYKQIRKSKSWPEIHVYNDR